MFCVTFLSREWIKIYNMGGSGGQLIFRFTGFRLKSSSEEWIQHVKPGSLRNYVITSDQRTIRDLGSSNKKWFLTRQSTNCVCIWRRNSQDQTDTKPTQMDAQVFLHTWPVYVMLAPKQLSDFNCGRVKLGTRLMVVQTYRTSQCCVFPVTLQ